MPKEQTDFYHEFKERLKNRSEMPFDEFVELALYHPYLGYYSKSKARVGKRNGTDFYTSSSTGSLWGKLVVDACSKILKLTNLNQYTFVEIAAEPDCSILNEIQHPFNSSLIFRLGDNIKIPDKAIVFSNEWLDAQPFKRFRFNGVTNEWHEIGVSLNKNQIVESDLLAKSDINFPKNSFPRYTIDWPTGSFKAIEQVLTQSWSGLFLTFDYGLPREILFNERPNGTARGYYRHQLESELLKRPGEQDLTCHLCWDELIERLKRNRFNEPELQSQESFFMHHAQKEIQTLLNQTKEGINSEIQTLKELIHPQNFGNKFQALWAVR